MNRIARLLLPDFSWLRSVDRSVVRHDFVAGLVSALIMIPQAAALASLAGMPPEYGIYTSLVPVVVAALWGSSWQALSGPNTAVALMIAAVVFPFANIGTELYVSLVLSLTLMVGMIQIAMAAVKAGSLLKFVSPSVISGLTNAVGVLIVVSAAWGLIGVHNMVEWHFLTRLNQLAHDLWLANPFALSVGLFTLAIGFALKRAWPRFYLVIAMFGGIVYGALLNWAFGEEATNIERLGHLHVDLLPMAVPQLGFDAMYLLQQLLIGALAIAIVGAMQSTVIARGIADRSGQHIDKNKEIMGQGIANALGSFFSCFAGSSSFNRSVVHFKSGARTPLAAILSAVFLAALIALGAAVFSHMPIPVMSAVLIMVGWGLIDLREFRRIFHLRSEAFIFYLTLLAALLFGLTEAVGLGMLASLFVYLKGVIAPKLNVMVRGEHGQHVIAIRGHLFFGTMSHLSSCFRNVRAEADAAESLIVDLRQLTYVDWAAIRMLRREAQEWRRAGGRFILRLHENQHDLTLGMMEHIGKIGGEVQYG
jgi:SulP family sulfate permease